MTLWINQFGFWKMALSLWHSKCRLTLHHYQFLIMPKNMSKLQCRLSKMLYLRCTTTVTNLVVLVISGQCYWIWISCRICKSRMGFGCSLVQ